MRSVKVMLLMCVLAVIVMPTAAFAKQGVVKSYKNVLYVLGEVADPVEDKVVLEKVEPEAEVVPSAEAVESVLKTGTIASETDNYIVKGKLGGGILLVSKTGDEPMVVSNGDRVDGCVVKYPHFVCED